MTDTRDTAAAAIRLHSWATLDPTQPYAADPYEIGIFRDDLRAVLDENREMREELAAFLDGAIPPYRPVSIPDMTDADRVRALRNLLDTSIRLERRRRGRNRELRALLEQACSLRLARPSEAVDPAVHTPERVKAYAAGLGYERIVDRHTFEVWVNEDREIVIPTIPIAPDYRKALGHLAQVFADAHGTGELGVLAAIAEAGDD